MPVSNKIFLGQQWSVMKQRQKLKDLLKNDNDRKKRMGRLERERMRLISRFSIDSTFNE